MSLSVGTHILSAIYTPDAAATAAGFSPSSTNPATTPMLIITGIAVTVSIPAVNTPLGSGVAVTVNITPVAAGTGTATVNLVLDGSITFAAQSLSNGSAIFNIPAANLTTVGSHGLTANFTPDPSTGYQSGSGTGTVTVTSAAVPVIVTVTPVTVTIGQNTNVTITVTDQQLNPASGQVTLVIDGTFTLPGQNLNLQGQTTFPVPSADINSVRAHSVTANFTDGTTFQNGTGNGSINVIGAATSTSISASSQVYFSPESITVTVANLAGGATPTGTVSLQVDGNPINPTNVALTNGSFTFQIAAQTLSVGTHQATASYTPDTVNFTSSATASPASFTITGVSTQTAVSAPDEFFGTATPVTITVQSLSGGLTPTGSVILDVDGGSGVTGGQSFTLTLIGGSITQSVSGLGAGPHTFVATYPLHGGFLSSVSPTVTANVNAASATVVISFGTVIYPAQAVITVTVTRVGGQPAPGSVSLSVDSGPPASGAIDQTTGQASFTLSVLNAGPHVLVATYTQPGFATATNQKTLTVQQALTSTAANILPANPVFGQALQVTATVSSSPAAIAAGGQPQGTVNLIVGGSLAQTGSLSASSTVSFTINGLAAGSIAIATNYLGQGNFGPSNQSIAESIAGAPVTLAIFAPSVSFGTTAQVTVTASSSAGTIPDGNSVSLVVDQGSPQAQTLQGQFAGQSISFSLPNLAGGSHSLLATMLAQGNFAQGSQSGTLLITGAGSQIAFSLVNPGFPNPVNVTTTVTATVGGAPADGSITLSLDGVNPITKALSNGAATFTFNPLPIAGNTHTLNAVYPGSANFQSSTGSQTFSYGATIPVLAINAPSLSFPTPAAATVTVTSGIGAPPDNTIVKLTIDGQTTLSSPVISGVASFSLGVLSVGVHTLVANFQAQGAFGDAVPATGSITITGSATSVAITAPGVNYPNDAFITATVTSSTGTPTGTVTLSVDGSTPPLSASIDNNAKHVFDVAGLQAGTHTLVAVYLGGGQFQASPPQSGNVVVTPLATQITASAITVAYPTDLPVSITVSATGFTVIGFVQITVDGAAQPIIKTLSSGSVSFTIMGLAAGSHTVQVDYPAQGNFAAAPTKTITALITGPQTTTAFTPSPPTPVTFPADAFVTVTITSGAGTPTGSVQFSVDGNAVSPQPPDPVTGATTFRIRGLPVGLHSVLATFVPTGNFGASNASATLQVLPVPTQILPTAQNVNFGTDAQASAKVTAGGLIPTGNVTLTVDGGQTFTGVLDSTGSASFDLGTTLSVGPHSLVFNYQGGGNFAAAPQVTATLTITGISTTISPIQAPDTPYGQPELITVTVTSSGGGPPVTGIVQISVDNGLPIGQQLINGSATINVSGLNVGQHTVKATFAAQGAFLAATPVSQTFNTTGALATITTVSAPNTPVGQSVPITVHVTDGSGNPLLGSVQLSIDGGPPGTQQLSGGFTVIHQNGLTVGTHTAVATFAKQGNYAASSGQATFRVTNGCNCAVFTSTAIKLVPSATKPCYWSQHIDAHHLIELFYDTSNTIYRLVFSWPGLSQCPPAMYTCAPANFACCGASTFSFQSGGTGCNALPPTITLSNLGNCICGHPTGLITCLPCHVLPNTLHVTLKDNNGNCACLDGLTIPVTFGVDPVTNFPAYLGTSNQVCQFVDLLGKNHSSTIKAVVACDPGDAVTLPFMLFTLYFNPLRGNDQGGAFCVGVSLVLGGTCSPVLLTTRIFGDPAYAPCPTCNFPLQTLDLGITVTV